MDGSTKSKDLELYNHWKETGDKKALGQLINQLSPLIYSEVRRQSGTLPVQALSAESKKWAIKAIQTYDPSKGTALSTHVTGYLRKVRRMNYKFQNMVRLPENLQLKYNQYSTALNNLTDRLNREPTDVELAQELGWSKAATVKYRNSLYKDLTESGAQKPTEAFQFNQNKILYDYIISQLTPEERIILDNVKTVSSTELAKMIGVNVNGLNYRKEKLRKKIQQIQAEAGAFR